MLYYISSLLTHSFLCSVSRSKSFPFTPTPLLSMVHLTPRGFRSWSGFANYTSRSVKERHGLCCIHDGDDDDDAEEGGVACVCLEEPRLHLSDEASCQEEGAAGCFPVLQPVIRAIFSLQATKWMTYSCISVSARKNTPCTTLVDAHRGMTTHLQSR